MSFISADLKKNLQFVIFGEKIVPSKALTSGTQKSGTHECTPKSGSGAGAPLLLSKERESGAALNFFGIEKFERFLAFQLKKC